MRLLLMFFLIMLQAEFPAEAARHALVVGNDNYSNVTPLKNARADARAMAKALESAGFRVKLALDLNRAGMNQALRQFKMVLSGGDEAIFYYAGHGVQLAGTNYLLPIDLQDADEEQIRDDAVQLQRILEDLAERQVRFSLAIIDACRDNPFKGAGRNVGSRGLAPTTAANGQMIIFSAGAGQKALDSTGQNDTSQNGLFTRVFVKEIEKPGLPIHDSLRNVREEVVSIAKSVGHDQVPAIYDQSIGKFYFRRGDSGSEPLRPAPAPLATREPPEPQVIAMGKAPAMPRAMDDQSALWESVERGNTTEDYDAYLQQYPKGKFVALAKARKAKLKEQAEQAVQQAEHDVWQTAERGGNSESYDAYLQQYPKGKFVVLAKARKAKLRENAEQAVQQVDHDAWQAAERKGTSDAYDTYLETYPNGRFAQLAKSRAKKTRDDKSAMEEQSVWQSAEKTGEKKHLQAYLDRYPTGRFAGLAKAKLANIAKNKLAEGAAAEARDVEKKKLLEKPIRTIALLPMMDPVSVRFSNRTINPFSLAGKLINRSEKRTLAESLDREIGAMSPSMASLILQNTEAALLRGGFSIRPSPEAKIERENPSRVDYGAQKTDADALLHIYFTDVGLVSSTFAKAFEPRIEVTFCLVRPISGQKCLERREIIYGGGVKRSGNYELMVPAEYRWATEEDLIAQINKVKEAMAVGAQSIGTLVGENIAKNQAVKK